MQRSVASLLIALVGLMALTPLALCPCAQRCREEAGAASPAAQATPTCCASCCAQRAKPARSDVEQARAPTPAEAPSTCPCCQLNGGGKLLLQPGAEIRVEAPLGVLAAFDMPTLRAATSVDLGRPAVGAVDDGPEQAPPAVRRAGVVLLI